MTTSRDLIARTKRAVRATEVELLLKIYPPNKDSCTGPSCILSHRRSILFRTAEDTSQETVEIVGGSSFNSKQSGPAKLLVGKEPPTPKKVKCCDQPFEATYYY